MTTHKIVDLDQVRQSARSGEFVAKSRRPPMPYYSILFEKPEDRVDEPTAPPDFFGDLNCDQIVDAITTGKDEYNLEPFFYSCLSRVHAIEYRHEVMADLENEFVFTRINDFAAQMREMRANFARVQKMHYVEQKQAWLLDAIQSYCSSIKSFATDLSNADLKSRGFAGFRDFLTNYAASPPFMSLVAETEQLKADLGKVQYSVLIKGSSFTVRRYDSEIDYSADVEATFDKFKQGAAKDYRVKFSASDDLNHVEAKILEFVAELHPEVFVPLTEYCTRHANYLDQTVAEFDREIQFYVAYLDYISPLRRHHLQFCYPRVSDGGKEVYDYEGFDIALAQKLTQEKLPVVPNGFHLSGRERILVVSGPNQGGKTTFARAFGQLHYIASVGCPVPGSKAQLFLFDQLFTHFEKEEKVENLRGKLEDDLVRIHHTLERASPRSIVVMNEVFTSTTLRDEIFLSLKIMEKIVALDVLCVWVTFLDELASFGPQTVSMVSTVVPENPALRTFKILRQPADGLAYAMAIAQKHALTYEAIKERIRS
jgi:DNA mismatch repair protein MutS